MNMERPLIWLRGVVRGRFLLKTEHEGQLGTIPPL